jgi:hypothetical protein
MVPFSPPIVGDVEDAARLVGGVGAGAVGSEGIEEERVAGLGGMSRPMLKR